MAPSSRPLHILLVFHSAYPQVTGGINAMIANLVAAWEAGGHRVSIFVPGEWDETTLVYETHGAVTLYRLRLRTPFDRRRPLRGLLGWLWETPRTLWRLRRLLRREGVDVLHLHTLRDYQLPFRMLRALGGPPYLLTFHGTDVDSFTRARSGEAALLRWVLDGADRVTAVARATARALTERLPGIGPVDHVPNGIRSLAEADVGAAPPGIDGDFFVQVGWVEPPKGQDLAIRAWGLLGRSHPQLKLLIIGSEPVKADGLYYPDYGRELEALLEAEGCRERVRFLGDVPHRDLLAILRRARGLFFPSRREGLPYALLEAGQAGLPVVVSDIPAFADIIEHGRHGLLAADGDPAAFAAAVARLMDDPALARRLGEALRQRIETDYSARGMAEAYITLFREMLR